MPVYTVRKAEVYVLGEIWWPMGAKCAQKLDLGDYELDIMLMGCGDGKELAEYSYKAITREDVERWVSTNTGDFSRILDFSASLYDHSIAWADEESECDYFDCMYGGEDD